MPNKIKIQPSGHEFTASENETLLDAALHHGIGLPYGCRNGRCGKCKGKVIEGNYEYPQGMPPALSETEHAVGMALFCKLCPTSDMLIETREIEIDDSIEPITIPAKVASFEKLNHDIMLINLKQPESQRMQFHAGQYIEILMDGNRRRAFSLANAPHDDAMLQLHVRYVPGGDFAEYAFKEMKEKDILRIEGPLGNFYLREKSTRPIIMLCGGSGFAPVKGVIEHAIHIGVERPIYLYRGAVTLDDLYLESLPRQWASEHDNIKYIPVLSGARTEDHWQGRSGFVHEAVLEDFDDLSEYDVYMCGPPQMIHTAVETFSQKGLPKERIFSDAFEFAVDPQDAD